MKEENEGPKSDQRATTKPDRNRLGLWVVMDGRARFDTDEASIMEALHDSPRSDVPRKKARKMWAGHDACICFGEFKGKDKEGRDIISGFEYVEDVK